jgi:hypothetical protein
MARKDRFPPEAGTKPTSGRPGTPTTKMPRASGPAPKGKSPGAEAPTEPPTTNSRAGSKPTERPPKPEGKPDATRTSGVKPRRPVSSDHPGATVDEVVADMSRDPRREDE